ncbi:hypothetical protein HK101_010074 [Irineochytrium annulatum]|nr:hypothetical protein HK101_010074 [Irineochytrium annulatum]
MLSNIALLLLVYSSLAVAQRTAPQNAAAPTAEAEEAPTGADSQCPRAVVTLTSTDDANALNGCRILYGINVGNNFRGDAIDLPSLTNLKGAITVNNASSLRTLSMPNLQTVSGAVSLNNNQILQNLDIVKLGSVAGIELISLPNVRSLTFDGLTSSPSFFRVSNTAVQSINGANFPTTGILELTSNYQLPTARLPVLTQITQGGLLVALNREGMSLDAPQLTTIRGSVITTLTGKLSLPKLERVVAGNFDASETNLTALTLPSLTSLDGTLSLRSNPTLANVSMPSLEEVGGDITFLHDPAVRDLSESFPRLRTVEGTVTLRLPGSLSRVSMPNAEYVRGGMDVRGADGSMDCQSLTGWKDGIVLGPFRCEASNDNGGSSESDSETGTMGRQGRVVGGGDGEGEGEVNGEQQEVLVSTAPEGEVYTTTEPVSSGSTVSLDGWTMATMVMNVPATSANGITPGPSATATTKSRGRSTMYTATSPYATKSGAAAEYKRAHDWLSGLIGMFAWMVLFC